MSNLGDSITSTPALTVTATSGGTVFNSTLQANNGLSVGGPITFEDSVTLADGGIGSNFVGAVTLAKPGGMTFSGFDGLTFQNGVTLTGDATILSNGSAMIFSGGSVSGPHALTIDTGAGENATLSTTSLARMGSTLTGLDVTAYNLTIPTGGLSIAGAQTYTSTSEYITLQGALVSTATGEITFKSDVNVTGNSSVTTVDSAITFEGGVDGSKALTLNSGTATKTFTGDIGLSNALGATTGGAALILQGTGATNFDGSVATKSGITAAGDVNFAGNVALGNGDTGSTFSGRVTTGAAVSEISAYDGIAFNGGLTLGADLSVVSNGSTIGFGGAVNTTGADTHALTLDALAAGAGTVTGLDHIGINSELDGLAITARTLSLPSTGLAVAGAMDFTAAGGITLNGALGTDGTSSTPATGAISLTGPLTLVTGDITVTTANADVTFDGTVNGAQALAVDAGTGTTTFKAAVGATTELTSLTTAAGGKTVLQGGQVKTVGDQTYGNAVELAATTTLSTSGAGDVSFAATVDSDDAVLNARALTVNTAGDTVFNGVVGSTQALASLSTDAPGRLVLNTTGVTTTGAQTVRDAMVLQQDATLTGLGVSLAGVDGAKSLTVDATTGIATLNGDLGATTGLTGVAVTGSAVVLKGDVTTANGDVTVVGPTTMVSDILIDTGAGAGDVLFSGSTSTVNGAGNLTITAGTGDATLEGGIGSITRLAGLSVSAKNISLPVVNKVGDTNQSYAALDDIQLNQNWSLGAAANFVADANNDGTGAFILANGVSLNTSNKDVSISAADIQLLGNSTVSSGAGKVTITAGGNVDVHLGSTGAGMTISSDELSRVITSGGLTLQASDGNVNVSGILAAESNNISGPLTLASTSGNVNFAGSASTFNELVVSAGGVANIGVDLSTTNDKITFQGDANVSGASTINSGGGNIDFQGNLDVALSRNTR